MSMDFKALVQCVKLKPRYLIGVGLTCLIIVGLPQSWRIRLGYDKSVAAYAGWISLAGLAALVYGSTILAADSLSKLATAWRRWRMRQQLPDLLRRLSGDEKSCLASYLERGVTSRTLPISDGIVGALVAKRILYRASNLSVLGAEFAFNLRPWVIKTLEENPDIEQDILGYAPGGVVIHGRL